MRILYVSRVWTAAHLTLPSSSITPWHIRGITLLRVSLLRVSGGIALSPCIAAYLVSQSSSLLRWRRSLRSVLTSVFCFSFLLWPGFASEKIRVILFVPLLILCLSLLFRSWII